MAKLRTIEKAIAEIKANDPNTSFTKNALTCAVKSGAIPSSKVGNRTLVDMDAVKRHVNKLGGKKR